MDLQFLKYCRVSRTFILIHLFLIIIYTFGVLFVSQKNFENIGVS